MDAKSYANKIPSLGTYLRRLQLETVVGASASLSGGFLYSRRKTYAMKKILIILALLVLLPVIAFFVLYYYQTAYRPFQGDLNAATNNVRAKHSLPALKRIEALDKIATSKCNDMLQRHYYAHQDPQGKYTWDLFEYDYKRTGENLVQGYPIYTSKADDVVNDWENSPDHLDNLIEPAFNEAGYAVCYNGIEYYIVQIFRG